MRRALGFVVTVVVLLVASCPATAKSVVSLSVEGPGLEAPLVLTGSVDKDGRPPKATDIAIMTSVYAQAIPTSSLPLEDESPASSLGPRYIATYVLDVAGTTFVQHIYPFAEPQAVTFAPPGQRWSDGELSRSGWTIGAPELRSTLVDAGVPLPRPALSGREPPEPSTRTTRAWIVFAVIGTIGVLGAAAARKGWLGNVDRPEDRVSIRAMSDIQKMDNSTSGFF